MEVELQQFNNERVERIKHLHEKHERETEVFDEESTRKGFRLAIDNKLEMCSYETNPPAICSVSFLVCWR